MTETLEFQGHIHSLSLRLLLASHLISCHLDIVVLPFTGHRVGLGYLRALMRYEKLFLRVFST